MNDPRVQEYAKLLVDRSLGVQAGWQVMIVSTPLARLLVEEVTRLIARRGAYALTRLMFSTVADMAWATEAPEELLAHKSPLEEHVHQNLDAWIHIGAPENTFDGSALTPERFALLREADRAFTEKRLTLKVPWVGCRYPTQATAQDAGMTLQAYEDFLYEACLLDWDEVGRNMRRLADRFDQAAQVRIVGEGTDLTLGLEGRPGMLDDGHLNMPGGEFFYSPVEDATEGVISYSEFPSIYGGHTVEGVRLEFRKGRVVEASSQGNQDFLLKTLDSDDGARVLGELGIGCNPGIQRHTKSVLFDEKIYGTVHLALGRGFPFLGSSNDSNVHWDMVKDLRLNGKIFLDNELVQENGKWLI